VFACGVNQEVDQAGGYKYQMPGETRGSAHPSNTNQSNPKDIPTVDITEGEASTLSKKIKNNDDKHCRVRSR
jgi:hypothetical protein